jgi:hypothetical protein
LHEGGRQQAEQQAGDEREQRAHVIGQEGARMGHHAHVPALADEKARL